MTAEYGGFANLVAIVSSLVAATTAVSLAFMKRASWQPPQESVPKATSRVAGLTTAIIIAILYVFAPSLGTPILALITVALAVIAVWGLMTSIDTNRRFSYFKEEVNQTEATRVLGGDELEEEAAKIRKRRKRSEQELLWDAHGRLDLVWSRASLAKVEKRSTLAFILLIAAGSSSLAAAGVLVATAALPGPPVSTAASQ